MKAKSLRLWTGAIVSWFEHYHSWSPRKVDAVRQPEAPYATGALILEQCRCGAVRTIEYTPGQAPVIRIGVVVTEEK